MPSLANAQPPIRSTFCLSATLLILTGWITLLTSLLLSHPDDEHPMVVNATVFLEQPISLQSLKDRAEEMVKEYPILSW